MFTGFVGICELFEPMSFLLGGRSDPPTLQSDLLRLIFFVHLKKVCKILSIVAMYHMRDAFPCLRGVGIGEMPNTIEKIREVSEVVPIIN